MANRPIPYSPDEEQRVEYLLASLRALSLEKNRDFWLVDNGTSWRLRWFAHATPAQRVRGDKLVNTLLNS